MTAAAPEIVCFTNVPTCVKTDQVDEPALPTTSSLLWSPLDPAGVEMTTLDPANGNYVTWRFARNLLVGAFQNQGRLVGWEGSDVRMGLGKLGLMIDVRNGPDAVRIIVLDPMCASQFLAYTHAEIPVGSEAESAAYDSLASDFEKLLTGGRES